MGFNSILPTKDGVLGFISRDFAAATFSVASDAGEILQVLSSMFRSLTIATSQIRTLL